MTSPVRLGAQIEDAHIPITKLPRLSRPLRDIPKIDEQQLIDLGLSDDPTEDDLYNAFEGYDDD
jgi:hypothetical protein